MLESVRDLTVKSVAVESGLASTQSVRTEDTSRKTPDICLKTSHTNIMSARDQTSCTAIMEESL